MDSTRVSNRSQERLIITQQGKGIRRYWKAIPERKNLNKHK